MACENVIKTSDPKAVNKTAEILKNGGVIVYPTDTLYGLGALVSKEKSVQRIFEIKGRNKNMSLPVLARDFEMLEDYALVPVKYEEMLQKFMPGAFMAILKLKKDLNPIITGGKDTIGIRISSNSFVKMLMEKLDVPLISTSANLSGMGNIYKVSELIDVFSNKVDLVIDSGSISPSKGSTIVDLTSEPPKILREGDISKAELSHYLNTI
ncbi:MAG: threonylcarbamoyl-AMP synthase [Candidatus Dadabacteria bacterium]|nr:threonylcarbamoyl-AMP synthase [Candidatus Dadabacteria bacterium]NIS09951.1 threonylcarbamoyl-AMP synthase [Candidatus Dadabacteria bacterium]NIV41867.1 threonylcarbamoyl-AMP synthase [Candidatus Dadabacteria bacterium]NIY22926.1 threonylcarbamoyl-AMP synthase [Candidatus Dadabacteria bacterium]